MRAAGIDEGTYTCAWLETGPLVLLYFHHFLPGESACSTQTRRSHAAIATQRLSSPAVNKSSMQVVASIIRRVDVLRVGRRAKRSARTPLGRPATRARAAIRHRRGERCSSPRVRAAMVRRVSRSNHGATSRSTAPTVSRFSAAPAGHVPAIGNLNFR